MRTRIYTLAKTTNYQLVNVDVGFNLTPTKANVCAVGWVYM